MAGCSPARKSPEIELWLIDQDDLILYRDIGDGKEEAIPIPGNKEMKKFVVIDREEYLRYLFDEIDKGAKK